MTSLYNELLLTVDKKPLSSALLKVHRITQEIQDAELEKWVSLELHGYWNSNSALTDDVIVPTYRTVPGYYTDDLGRKFVITDPELNYINEMRLRFGVIELESFTNAKGPLTFRPSNFTKLIQDNLNVEVTTFNFTPSSITPVLTAIRTQLTKYIVMRKEKLGETNSLSDSSKADEIIEIKPNIYGIGINLRALFRKLQNRN